MLGCGFSSVASRRLELGKLVAAGCPVEVPGAYDVLSARIIEKCGFPIVLVSGFGLSASRLGMPDLELYTRDDNVATVRNVVLATSVPVMADADDGYGAVLNVMRTVREFEFAGASSVTLEDQVFPKKCPLLGAPEDLLPLEVAVDKIRAAVAARSDPSMLIIARTDARSPEEAVRRAQAYGAAGADLIKPISAVVKSLDVLIQMHSASGKRLSISMMGWIARQHKPLEKLKGVVAIGTYPLLPVQAASAALHATLGALREKASLNDLPVTPLSERQFRDTVETDSLLEIESRYTPH